MISQNKMKHILSVARKCQKIAEDKNLSKEMQNACYVMGFLHDIGYELCDKNNITQHPINSYNMITDFIKYSQDILPAIKNHGTKYSDLSIFDEILNTADLTTNFDGTNISIEDRLNAIKQHHGETSLHYEHAQKQTIALAEINSNQKG